MIGIGAIGCHVPEQQVSNLDRLGEFSLSREFLENKIGFTTLSRKAESDETSDLCLNAIADLRGEIERLGRADPTADMECVILCTQNPDGRGLPHTSAIVHGKLGLPTSCACFDISLGCSGFVHSLSIAAAFMDAHGMSNGLLLTADPYSKIVDQHDRNTALIFGDAACATWLTRKTDAALLSPVRARFHTEGHRHRALQNRDGTLHMDGRAVFNFSAAAVPLQIEKLLAEAGLDQSDIDLFLLHQGSKYIVDAIRLRLALDEGAGAPLQSAGYGNTVSSSIPLLLRPVVHHADVRRVVLCGFGVGLAVATSLLERV